MVMASYLPSAFSLSLTARDRLPTWAEPSPSAVMAAPEPPPLRTTFTPEFFFINASFRAVQTSVMEVEPAMVRVPVSLVSEEPSALDEVVPPTSPVLHPANTVVIRAAAATAPRIFFIIVLLRCLSFL